MAFPTIFNNLAAGGQPLSLVDAMFSVVGGMGLIQCTASGTNTIVLTPITNMPTVSSYTNYQLFGFVGAATNTGATTVNISGLGAKGLTKFTTVGPSALTGGEVQIGQFMVIGYDGTEFVILTVQNGSQLAGTLTNDAASAGNVGENPKTQVPIGSPVAIVSTTITNISSLFLAAGDWDLYGEIGLTGTGTVTSVVGCLSTTSATTDQNQGGDFRLPITQAAGADFVQSLGMRTVSIPVGGATVYLVGQATFSGSKNGFGFIGARRAR